MSTYNGKKYLTEQIDSILSQKGVHVELFIRDDGSSDSTRDIITRLTEKHNNIHADFGERIWWEKSFAEELFVASGFEYYAFSDQDDVWKPEKLITGVKAIMHEEEQHGKNIPVVWQSSHIYTDSELNPLFVRSRAKRVTSLESFLLRPYGSGNALVFNARVRELMEKVYAAGCLDACHDFWTALVAHAFGGTVILSPNAFVLFRQHGRNTSGTPLTFHSRLKSEWRKILIHENWGPKLASTLLKCYGDELSPSVRDTIILATECKNNFMYRLRILFSPKFRTGDIRLTIIGKLKVLFGIM